MVSSLELATESSIGGVLLVVQADRLHQYLEVCVTLSWAIDRLVVSDLSHGRSSFDSQRSGSQPALQGGVGRRPGGERWEEPSDEMMIPFLWHRVAGNQ